MKVHLHIFFIFFKYASYKKEEKNGAERDKVEVF